MRDWIVCHYSWPTCSREAVCSKLLPSVIFRSAPWRKNSACISMSPQASASSSPSIQYWRQSANSCKTLVSGSTTIGNYKHRNKRKSINELSGINKLFFINTLLNWLKANIKFAQTIFQEWAMLIIHIWKRKTGKKDSFSDMGNLFTNKKVREKYVS